MNPSDRHSQGVIVPIHDYENTHPRSANAPSGPKMVSSENGVDRNLASATFVPRSYSSRGAYTITHESGSAACDS
jgi:hypothetical protein